MRGDIKSVAVDKYKSKWRLLEDSVLSRTGTADDLIPTSADNDIEVCNVSFLCPASNDASDAVAYQSYYQVCRVGDKDYFHHCAMPLKITICSIKEDVTKRKLRKPLAYSISNVVTHMSSTHFEWLKLSKVLDVSLK